MVTGVPSFTDANWYKAEAVNFYARYWEAQQIVSKMEKEALEAASNSTRQQAFLLNDSRTEAGWAYKIATTNRNTFLRVAEVNSAMATMLQA